MKKMIIVPRPEVPKEYKKMLKTESHHDHIIIQDEHGTLRWKKDEFVTSKIPVENLTEFVLKLEALGFGKNSEIYRKLYRCQGFTLSSYEDIFYFYNEDSGDYQQPKQ